jgi:hypothetical protein
MQRRVVTAQRRVASLHRWSDHLNRIGTGWNHHLSKDLVHWELGAHRIASHRIASHRIASHRIASHRIASHRVA